ncbi:MAG: Hpt domain-containing protein [Phycisphaerae bacterium]
MSEQNPPLSASKLISELLADDPDLREVVEEFVEGLDGRMREIQTAYQKLDWQMLGMLAHRLKGAGGSYGYPAISMLGRTMETSFKAQQPGEFTAWMEQLDQLVKAAKAGLSPQ